MITIEKSHLELCHLLTDDINHAIKSFNPTNYKTEAEKYETLLMSINISVEKKKKEMIALMHELLVKTLGIDPNKIASQKSIFGTLKNNLGILRNLVVKLRDTNYYLQDTLLQELKLKQRPLRFENLTKTNIQNLINKEKRHIGAKELRLLEHTSRLVMNKLAGLKEYKMKKHRIAAKSKLEIKSIEKILQKQSELLYHIEAKLPPPSKAKPKLLKKNIFSEWMSRVIALMANLENEYRKEAFIFKKLSSNVQAKLKLNKKISVLIKEKLAQLKRRERKLLSARRFIPSMEHHTSMHNYAAVLRL